MVDTPSTQASNALILLHESARVFLIILSRIVGVIAVLWMASLAIAVLAIPILWGSHDYTFAEKLLTTILWPGGGLLWLLGFIFYDMLMERYKQYKHRGAK